MIRAPPGAVPVADVGKVVALAGTEQNKNNNPRYKNVNSISARKKYNLTLIFSAQMYNEDTDTWDDVPSLEYPFKHNGVTAAHSGSSVFLFGGEILITKLILILCTLNFCNYPYILQARII